MFILNAYLQHFLVLHEKKNNKLFVVSLVLNQLKLQIFQQSTAKVKCITFAHR